MTKETGRRKEFADAVVASVTEIAKQHGLEDIKVHRDADPVVVALRGCLRGKKKDPGEPVEMVLQISPDIARAEQIGVLGASISDTAAMTGVFRAFDLSEMVARDTVTGAMPAPRDDSCPPEKDEREG